MKILTITTLLFLTISCSNPEAEKKKDQPFETEQLYKGYSKRGNYLCHLKISPDNTVIFTYATVGNGVYGEHSGTIKALNDSTFHVSCELTFGQFACKAPVLDSLTIFIKPPSLIHKKSILVQYENEDLMNQKRMSKSGVSFAFDPNLFNEYTPATILTDHMHPITGEALRIKAVFGSGYDFVSGDKLDFDIVISGDSLYTIGDDSSFQMGHVQLKKQKTNNPF